MMDELTGWLEGAGFRREADSGERAWWYRKGRIRVVIEDEGYITVYVFEPDYDVLVWKTAISQAPHAFMIRAITFALDTAGAALLPDD